MKSIWSSLFIVCVLMSFISSTLSETDDTDANDQPEHGRSQPTDRMANLSFLSNAGNDVHSINERIQQSSKSNRPLRNIVMGIYKNYKSTYLGNKTLTEYKQTLRESMKTKHQLQQQQTETESPEGDNSRTEAKDDNDDEQESQATDAPEETVESITTEEPDAQKPFQPETTEKDDSPAKEQAKAQVENYNIGAALNMSLDMHNSIVKVNLDGESLKELITGRWLNDNSDEGRGKKYEMVTRILPLFILPFLIQSAIVPFLVTKLKLLLMKSLLVGKLAIFLLIISAFRNGNKMMQTYEVAPSYWASEPSRRSEMAAAASNMAYNGYRVEGKPAAWVN